MKYRIVYWLGSMTTEVYLVAHSKDKAVQKFCALTGHSKDDIIRVEELKDG